MTTQSILRHSNIKKMLLAIIFDKLLIFMCDKNRGKAYRRWKTFTKYVSKIKKRMGWYVDDPNAPRGHRHPKNWKELDTDDSHAVKMLRKTSTRWSSKWEDSDDHIRIKKTRKDGKNIIDKELQ